MLKLCSKCKEIKELNCFTKTSRPNELRPDCKDFVNKRRRENNYHERYGKTPSVLASKNKYRSSDKGKRTSKNCMLILKFGISIDDYETMLDKQNNKCLICEKEFNKDTVAQVDHCHKTGKIRGLLCKKCNLGLGHFEDNINSLKMSIKYLENN